MYTLQWTWRLYELDSTVHVCAMAWRAFNRANTFSACACARLCMAIHACRMQIARVSHVNALYLASDGYCTSLIGFPFLYLIYHHVHI